jgi:hypothetical protein
MKQARVLRYLQMCLDTSTDFITIHIPRTTITWGDADHTPPYTAVVKLERDQQCKYNATLSTFAQPLLRWESNDY